MVRTDTGFHILRVDKYRAAGLPFARRGAGPDPRDALPEGGRAALPGLDLEGPARAALTSRCSTESGDLPRVRHPRHRGARLRRGLRAPARAGVRHARRRARRRRWSSVGRDCRLTSDAYAAALREGIARDRARRGRPRRVSDAARLLRDLPLGARRRRPGHRQPQPGRLQRLQALPRHARRCTASRSRTCAGASRRGAFRHGRGHASSVVRSSPAYQDYVVENVGPLGAPDRASSSTPATAPAARSRRRSTARLGARGDRALLRPGRPLPEPPSRSDGRREHAAPDRARCARRGAELGIAFDGDADRIGVVDAAGRIDLGRRAARALRARRAGAESRARRSSPR